MQPFRFTFNGEHELIIPDGGTAFSCAQDIIEGHSYPFPMGEDFSAVVDIGAHVGEFTIMAALIWPKATVHAFEPFPDIMEVMRENLKQFTNIVYHEQAVAANSGRLPLHVSGMGTFCNSLKLESMASPTGETIDVEVIGVKQLAALKPDFLKIDAEGVEQEIIAGLHKLGKLSRIRRIALEFHTEDQRVEIDRLLYPTHTLIRGRICNANQGELTYVRRK